MAWRRLGASSRAERSPTGSWDSACQHFSLPRHVFPPAMVPKPAWPSGGASGPPEGSEAKVIFFGVCEECGMPLEAFENTPSFATETAAVAERQGARESRMLPGKEKEVVTSLSRVAGRF
jgi:hypothetical protein